MRINLPLVLLVIGQLLTKVWSTKNQKVDGSKLDFIYRNSNFRNGSEIKFGDESNILDNWINDLPLKVITHGWLASDDNTDGVFEIAKAYIDKGGYNVITVDWSIYGKNPNYMDSAKLTKYVGAIVAKFLERLVEVTGINPSNIHLIGHSLGAHVMGSCGMHFKSGKIGRITGLDPAGPLFRTFYVWSYYRTLKKDDADFVDVIHTTTFLGVDDDIGHVDFYPNYYKDPQPGCKLTEALSCSHSMSYIFYAKSIIKEMYFMATKCNSWEDLKSDICSNNIKIPMGHKTNSSERGRFFIETKEIDIEEYL